MARDYRAEYQARQARARAAGFDSYNVQRTRRAEAATMLPPTVAGGRTRVAVETRDVLARALSMPPGKARIKLIVDTMMGLLGNRKTPPPGWISPRRLIGLLPY